MEHDGGNARQGEGNVVVHLSPVATVTPDASTGLATTSHSTSSASPSPYPNLNSAKVEPLILAPKVSSTSNQKQNHSRRRSLPFAFPPLFFQSNTSSTSLAPSTAEGKPIPVDDTTAAHRISALKKLNSSYPSAAAGRGHTYAKSTGAQSSTYSQPVLVRTYSGPSPSQGGSYSGVRSPKHHQQQSRSSRYRPPSSSRGVSRRVPLPLSSKSGSDLSSRPTKPALSATGNNNSNSGSTNGGGVITMPHHKPKKSSIGSKLPLSWQWKGGSSSRRDQDEAKLPPLEAFSFKSFMADMQTQGGGSGENDIGADLDRIAEICARSRYSLSSQYEMHVAPHGSGISFVNGSSGGGMGGSRRKGHSHSRSGGGGVGGGPTLQAISSDDDNENTARSHQHRKRRSAGGGGGRRRSVAYGTLETIMSSSRSSEEDKTKKKSAAEIMGEVRGRAARKAGWDNGASTTTTTTTTTGSGSTSGNTHGDEAAAAASQTGRRPRRLESQASSAGRLARKKSASFAAAVILDSSRHHHQGENSTTTPSSSASALVSEPAMPQTSTSHLGVRTASANVVVDSPPRSPSDSQGPGGQVEVHLADELPHHDQAEVYGGPRTSTRSLHSHAGSGSWSTWLSPWRSSNSNSNAGINDMNMDTEGSGNNAEGSLRQLLRSVDSLALGSSGGEAKDKGKDKAVHRE
ncbi:hypothetical protein QBC37DRAFT_286208 [Rhypophila decipiens]|uniref:Uncharacterized protein n=1 Tax=Rhypophila decipiens TaxID=261697 RepID=A0AAN6Y6G8_9PEZI|nr:hypothetical protein QBC37DRAFT_286208 [Rhypophila decipiens]